METIGKELRAGKVLLGLHLQYACASIVERIGVDWDWVWIDGQHGQHDYRSILECVRAADLVGRFSIVRVPGHEFGPISLAMDTAASGLMVPFVDSAAQAHAVVAAAKFPPLGMRSYGGRRPIDLYGRGYSDTSNQDNIVIAQIETPEALERADEIAAVPGIDVLFFSADDLSLRLGMQMLKPREEGALTKEMKNVSDAAKAHGKAAGGVFPSPKAAVEALNMGYQLLAIASDVVFLAQSSKAKSTEIKKALGLLLQD